MLEKVKKALRVATDAFDDELLDLIASAVADIRVIGAVFTADEIKTEGEVTDYDIPDPLIRQAVITYCKMNFGQPDNYAQLEKSYWEQKAQLRENSDYGPK